MSNQSPPTWAPNAVPTPEGWVDPKTGELLVSKKGLSNIMTGYGRNRKPAKVEQIETNVVSFDEPEKPEPIVSEEPEPVESIEVSEPSVPEEPVRRKAGRPKKKI